MRDALLKNGIKSKSLTSWILVSQATSLRLRRRGISLDRPQRSGTSRADRRGGSSPSCATLRAARIDTEVVQRCVGRTRRELGAPEPAARELILAVGHVLAAEHTEPEKFSRRELRAELGIEVASTRRDQFVAIVSLHAIVDRDCSLGHCAVLLCLRAAFSRERTNRTIF
jgi:hypothetical protein